MSAARARTALSNTGEQNTMTDIDELLTKLRAEKQDYVDRAYACDLQARAHQLNADLLASRIQGIEEGRDLTLAATQAPDQGGPVKTEADPAPAEQPRRERRDIRGLVYAKLADVPDIGMTDADLVLYLGAAKSSVVSALAYHEANGDARFDDNEGLWFANVGGKWASDKATSTASPAAAQNGEDPSEDDTRADPPSVVDVIRAAGEDGITDKELAARGYAFVSVVKAKNAGEVEIREGRIYAVGNPEQ